MVLIVSLIIGKKDCLMSNTNQMLNILKVRFDEDRASTFIDYFSNSIRELEQGEWENSLVQSGKFVEATIKLLWVFAGKMLPPQEKSFKVGTYAQKIVDQVSTNKIQSDGVRLQIPRACIFLYNITSNRGGRHDSDEFDPNEMDAVTVSSLCSWIFAELVRFCFSNTISPDEAKKIVESITERRYPFFEAIGERIYIDNSQHNSAIQCALMILYKKFPNRMQKSELIEAVTRHKYKKSAIKFSRLLPFIDVDENNNILLRVTGRKKVERLLLH